MTLFKLPRWLRMYIRSRTGPIEENTAASWKQKLSIAYAIIAWNAFGVVAYNIFSGKADWAAHYGIKSEEELSQSPGQLWAKTLGIKNATVYRISGFDVKTYTISDSEDTKDM
ncbi:uncharacterized protein LOC132708205 [Cylas formicarius]|uniref:uncharacterized protein LOC132708205 n=1 Tax=Cylas formicarius TaxID=197179 RepID=UPI0029589BCB|nr:uncharacterized protein LOC132708205 [Cylas formicarius]